MNTNKQTNVLIHGNKLPLSAVVVCHHSGQPLAKPNKVDKPTGIEAMYQPDSDFRDPPPLGQKTLPGLSQKLDVLAYHSNKSWQTHHGRRLPSVLNRLLRLLRINA